jgi:hypothetical protein
VNRLAPDTSVAHSSSFALMLCSRLSYLKTVIGPITPHRRTRKRRVIPMTLEPVT